MNKNIGVLVLVIIIILACLGIYQSSTNMKRASDTNTFTVSDSNNSTSSDSTLPPQGGTNPNPITPTPSTPSSGQIEISGTYGCLPHRDTSGPQTMECAFGLKTSSGWYALDMSALPNSDMNTTAAVRVKGILLPANEINSNTWQRYNILGIIKVSSVTKVGTTTSPASVVVTPLSLIEDSRCPSDVQCIWAGTVKVSVRVANGSTTAEDTVTLGESKVIAGATVTLTSVLPAKGQATIPFSQYKFTFTTK